jgi:hypothetical protein
VGSGVGSGVGSTVAAGSEAAADSVLSLDPQALTTNASSATRRIVMRFMEDLLMVVQRAQA